MSDGRDAARRRGRAVAALHTRAAPELYEELCAAGGAAPDDAGARAEWAAFAAYACVRALVAAYGFGDSGADAVDAFHDALFAAGAGPDARRAAAERYEVYGTIVRNAGTDDPAAIARRLGAEAATRLAGAGAAAPAAELAGALHEALYEAALDAARAQA